MSSICSLSSKDGEVFELPLKDALLSGLIKTMNDDEAGEAQEFPMSNLSSTILSKIVEFLKQMASDPMPEIQKVCNISLFLFHIRLFMFTFNQPSVCQHIQTNKAVK